MVTKVRAERENIMLCYPTDEGRIHRLGPQIFADPKLNGERCRVEWFHNEPILISSFGNQFWNMDHITDALKELAKKEGQLPWDGELYKHGWGFSRIHSACSRKVNINPDTARLEFHIFDYQDPHVQQWYRASSLLRVKEYFSRTDPLQVVERLIINNEDWAEAALTYCDQGYEGTVLRSFTGMYVMKRNTSILKYKPTEKDEYLIIGTKEGTGWAEGMLGSFLVRGEDDTVFSVGSGKTLTKPRREKFWKIREELPGKMLLTKHEKLKTRLGKPVGAVAMEVIGVDI